MCVCVCIYIYKWRKILKNKVTQNEEFNMNCLNFRFDTVLKRSIKNFRSYKSKSYASVVLCDSEVIFLGKGRMQPFFNFFIVFFIYCVAKPMR